MDNGWVKIHRKLFDNGLSEHKPYCKLAAWIFMVTMANHKDGCMYVRGNKVEVKRGQLGWSELSLAEQFGWSRGKIRRFLLELKTVQQIVQQKNFITSLITITNYDLYQSNDTTDGTADGTADGQQTDSRRYTNKKDKKEKNEKKGRSSAVWVAENPPTYQDIADFIESKGNVIDAKFFYNYFTDGNWIDTKGNKVYSWKQKANSWIEREKAKTPTLDSFCRDFTEDDVKEMLS